MPIIISEIEISVEVTPIDNVNSDHSLIDTSVDTKEEIIKECVERVMEIINNKNER